MTTNHEVTVFNFGIDPAFVPPFANNFPCDQKKIIFTELLANCLEACEKCQLTSTTSCHINNQLAIVGLPSNLPHSEDHTEVPQLLQPVLNFLKTCHSTSSTVADFEDFFTFVIETISDYLTAPLKENAQLQLKTGSHTYTSKVVIADIAFVFDWLLQPGLGITFPKHKQRILDTCAQIVSHPELAVELFLPALVVLRRSLLQPQIWLSFDFQYQKKILDIAVETFKVVAHYMDEYRLICCRLLICFVVGLHRSLLSIATEAQGQEEAQTYTTVTQAIQQLLDDTATAISFAPASFQTLQELIKEWLQFPEVTEEAATDLFLRFWTAADARMVVSIFPKFLPCNFTVETQKRLLLQAASELVKSDETAGKAFQIIAWIFETAERYKLVLGGSENFGQFFLQYLNTDSPLHGETEQRFEYLKKAGIRCLLAILPYKKEKQWDDMDSIYRSLAMLLTNSKYANEILSNWIEANDHLGCNDPVVVSEISSQLLSAVSMTIHGGGVFVIPPGRPCPDLFEFHMKKLKKLDRKRFYEVVPAHLDRVMKMLMQVKENHFSVTSAVVSLKCYAMQKLLLQNDYEQVIAKSFPEAQEYMNSLLKTLNSIKETVSVILLYYMSFLVHTVKQEGLTVSESILHDVMNVFPSFKDTELEVPAVQITGDLLMVVKRKQADELLKCTWGLYENVMLSNSSQGFNSITDLIFAWPETLCEYPLIQSLCSSLKSSESERYLIMNQLLNLAYQAKDIKDKEFVLDDLRQGWADCLPALVSSVSTHRDKYAFKPYMKLFHAIFREEDFVEVMGDRWPDVPEASLEDLFRNMKKESNLSKILDAMSDTLGIPLKKKKRKRVV